MRNAFSLVELSIHRRLIWTALTAVAVRLPGATGGEVGTTASRPMTPGGLVSVTNWRKLPVNDRLVRPPVSVPVYWNNG